MIRKYEYTRDQLIEFKKETELRAKASASQEEESQQQQQQSSGLGALGGFSAAPMQTAASTKKSVESFGGVESKTGSILEGLKPIWNNKETMSPLMRQIVQAKEIR